MELLLKVLAMGGVKRKPAVQALVEKRIRSRLCLCQADAGGYCVRSCEEAGGGRGRCAMHYARFNDELRNRSKVDQLAIEMKLIKQGQLLDNHEIRKYRKAGKAVG
jgi:hypothetical protein